MSSSRVSRDQLFMNIAFMMSERATCKRLSVGAVLVKDKRTVGCGYNGTPPEEKHCSDEQCDMTKSCKISIHAEENLIAFSAKHGISTRGTKIYVTHEPCRGCAELIIQAGITEVIFAIKYGEGSVGLLKRRNVLVKQFEGEIPV